MNAAGNSYLFTKYQDLMCKLDWVFFKIMIYLSFISILWWKVKQPKPNQIKPTNQTSKKQSKPPLPTKTILEFYKQKTKTQIVQAK